MASLARMSKWAALCLAAALLLAGPCGVQAFFNMNAGPIDATTKFFDVTFQSDEPIGGYQFNFNQNENAELIYDGSKTPTNPFPLFSVSGGQNTVVCFSLSAATIDPSPTATLLVSVPVADVQNSLGGVTPCLLEVVVAQPNASPVGSVLATPACGSTPAASPPPPPPPLAVLSPSPPPPPTGTPQPPSTAPVTLQIGSFSSSGTADVNFQSSVEIAGYQFSVVHDFTEEPINLSGVASNFPSITTSGGPSNIVVGFSLSASTIPAQATLGLLCTLTAADTADFGAPACLVDVIVSDPSASPYFTSFAQCVVSSAPSPPPPPPSSVTLTTSDIGSDLSFNVVYTSTVEFAGFEMNFGIGSQPAPLASATTTFQGFSVSSVPGSPTVVGFSLQAAQIPISASASVLLSGVLDGSVGGPGDSLCLTGVIISSAFQQGGGAQSIPTQYVPCPVSTDPSPPPPPPGTALPSPPPPAQASGNALFAVTPVVSNVFSISLANSVPIAGFQCSVFSVQTGFALGLTSANTQTQLDVQVGTNTVLGFSLTGATIPPAQSTLPLAEITVDAAEGLSNGSEVCLADIVASSAAALAVPSSGAECPTSIGTISLLLIDGADALTKTILYSTNVAIAAFQFETWQTSPVAKAIPTGAVLPAYVANAGMQVSIAPGNNIVIGFSLTNQVTFLTGSNQVLLELTMSAIYNSDDLCLFDPIMSLASAEAVQIESSPSICALADIPSSPPPLAPFPPGGAPPPLQQVAVSIIASPISKGGEFDVTIFNTVEISSVQLIIKLDNEALQVTVASQPLEASYSAFFSQGTSQVAIASSTSTSIPAAGNGQLLVKLFVAAFDSTMAFKTPCLESSVAASSAAILQVSGACPTNQQPTSVTLLKLDGAQVGISVAPPTALSGFELLFNVADQPANIIAVEASDALPATFAVSYSGNKVTGTSNGDLIPAAPVQIFTMTLASEADLSSICFTEVPLLKDANENGIPILAEVCTSNVVQVTTTPLLITTQAGSSFGYFSVLLQGGVEIAGFEFKFLDQGGSTVSLLGFELVLADDGAEDFTVVLSNGEVVVGYTTSDYVISPGTVLILTMMVDPTSSPDLVDGSSVCLDPVSVVKDVNDLELPFEIVCEGGPSPSGDDDDSSNVGAIVGGTVGGIVLLIIIIALLLFCCRKRDKSSAGSQSKEMKMKHVEMLPEGGATNGAGAPPLSVRVAGAAEGTDAPAAV